MSEIDQKAIAKHARYVRNPSLRYLGNVLGIAPDLELATMASNNAYNFNSNNTPLAPQFEYYEAAKRGTILLTQNLVGSLENDNLFLGLITEYINQTEYKEDQYYAGFRSRTFHRVVRIPTYYVNLLDNLLLNLMNQNTAKAGYIQSEPLGLDYIVYNDEQSRGNLRDRLEEIRDCTALAIHNNSLESAIEALFKWQTSWLVNVQNQSRSTNYFNVILEQIGYQPISHGVIDFAAASMNSRQFETYVKYVIFDVEQQIQR